MGYSPWGHKESDTTEQLTYIAFMLHINLKQNKIWGQNFNPYSFELSCDLEQKNFLLDNHFCPLLGGGGGGRDFVWFSCCFVLSVFFFSRKNNFDFTEVRHQDLNYSFYILF